MVRQLLLLFMLVQFSSALFAQLPPPCPSNTTPPSDFCAQTCIYCNFNGINSSTAGYTSETPPGFCGSIENNQWLGFIAGETSATFTGIASGCTNGDGIQVALYSSCGSSPLGCYGGTSGGATIPASISTSAMIPGQNYFFMIDGWAGDQCSFVIVASPPSAITPPFPSAPVSMTGATTVCPGATVRYCVPPIPGAAGYTWNAPPGALINGQVPPVTIVGNANNCVNITYPPNATAGVICVNGANSCYTGPPLCTPVSSLPIPPTFLPQSLVCPEDLPYLLPWGTEVYNTGVYENTYVTAIGCDSVVRKFVQVKIAVPTVLPPTTLCGSQTMSVCGVAYSAAGSYTGNCPASDGCDSNVIFTIIRGDITAQINGGGTITCTNQSVQLSQNPGPGTPTWYNINLVNPVGNGPTYTATAPGTYILDVSFTIGSSTCTAFDTIVIPGNITPPTATATGGVVGCGTATTINATTNANPATFNWSGPGLSSSSQSPSVSTPGNYVVTVTNPANGCTSSATAVVTGSTDIPVINLVGGALSCSVTSVNLTATTSNAPTATYLWSNGATTNSITVNTAGTYSVVVTNPANSCTATGSFTVDSNTLPPDVSATPQGGLTCTSNSVDITAFSNTTGATFAWSNGGTGASTTVNAAGTYTVVATGTNGCTNSATATVAANTALPDLSVNNGALTCANSSVTLQANSTASGAQYTWTGGPSGPSQVVSTPGSYNVVVTAANGCTNTATAVVTGDFTPPVASATGGDVNCIQTSVQLNASSSASNSSYSWTGPNSYSSNQQNPTVNIQGTYNCIITNNDNGCTSTATTTVSADISIPSVAVFGNNINCNNPIATIDASSPNLPNATFTWNNSMSTPSINVNAGGTYTVTITNPTNGCTSTGSYDVLTNIVPPGVDAAVASVLTCANPSTTISATSPVSGATFTWSNSANTADITVNTAGAYTVVATASNGCTSSATVTVSANNAEPGASVNSPTLSCAVSSVALTATSPTPDVTYSWPSSGTNNSVLQVDAPGNYNVVITGQNGCTSTAVATVNGDFVAPAGVVANGGTLTCSATSISLSGNSTTPGVTYNWTNTAGGQFPTQNPTVSGTGTYTLVVTNPANGCTASATAEVQAAAGVPDAAAVGGTLDCNNPSIQLSGSSTTPGVTLAWTGLTGASPTVNQPGNYTLVVTDPSNGCSNTVQATVALDDVTPVFTLSGGQLSCSQTSLNVQLIPGPSQGTLTYDWGALGTAQNPTVTQAGTYSVIVTGENGCTSTESVVVTADTNLPELDAVVGVLTCTNTSLPINLTVTAPGNVTGITWLLNGTQVSTIEDPSVTMPGTYEVTVATDNGCTSSLEVIVNQDIATPDLMTNGGVIGCTVFSVDLMAMSQAGVSYNWTGPGGFTSTQQEPNVNVNGDYIVVVTGANGCTSTGTVAVTTDYAAADIAIAQPQTLTCTDDMITLSTTLTSPTVPVQSVLWSSAAGYSSTEEDPADITAPGVYTVLVTTVNGCTATETVTVNQNIATPGAAATDNTLTCVVVSVEIEGSSPTPGVTYSWTAPDGVTILNGAAQTVTVAGNYVLTVTGANGCISTATSTVELDGDFPDAAAVSSIPTITCANQQAILTGSSTTGGVQYNWLLNNAPVGNQSSLIVTTEGTYTLQVTDPTNGCRVEEMVTIGLDVTPPTASALGGTVDCISGAVTLAGSSTTPNVSYRWIDATGNPYPTQNPSVSNIGTYILTVTSLANGCTSTATAQVLQNQDAPVATVTGTDILDCDTDEVILTANIVSPANAVGVWSSPSNPNLGTGTTLTVSQAGTYTFTVVNPLNGCRVTPNGVVTANFTEPQASALGALIDCNNRTVPISALSPTSGVTYTWSGPAGVTLAGSNQTVNVSGTYTVVVTGTNGCTSSATALVSENTQTPDIAATAPIITCANPTVTVSSTSSVANLTYAWSGGLAATANPVVSAPATYSLQVTNPVNGCTNTFSLPVTENRTAPNASAQGDILTCAVQSIGISANSTTPGATYQWFLNNNPVSSLQNPTVSVTGTYTVVVTDPVNGCTSEATAIVSPDANAPNVQAAPANISCATPTTALVASSTTPGVTYSWSGPGGFTSTLLNPTVSAVGTYTLTVLSPANGCTSTAQSEVAGNFAAPSISVTPPSKIDCNNSSVTIQSTANGQGIIAYNWSAVSGAILQGSTTATPEVGAGTYNVIITDSGNGCTSQQNVLVEADPATPSGANSTVRNVTCFGDTNGAIILQGIQGGTPPFMYSFNNRPFSAQTQWSGLAPGIYPLLVEDALGCEWATSFTIQEPQQLQIDLGPDLLLELGDSLRISNDMLVNYPNLVTQYVVSPPEFYNFICDTCGSEWYKAFYTNRYQVTILDSNGCKATDDRTIIVDRTRNVYVPNVFDPNATDVNALLTVYGNTKHVTRIKSFKIYDRWGEAVHEALDFAPNTYDKAWNGFYREKLMNPSVFVWVAEVEFVDGLIEIYKGDVTVVGN